MKIAGDGGGDTGGLSWGALGAFSSTDAGGDSVGFPSFYGKTASDSSSSSTYCKRDDNESGNDPSSTVST